MQFDKILTTNKIHDGINACLFIVVHHTGSTGLQGNINALSGKATGSDKDVSCHYIVGQKGELIKVGKDTDILRHAGGSKWKNYTDLNRYAIGIEVVSDGYQYTDVQRAKVKELIEYLMNLHNIPQVNVIRHLDISGYRGKRDIGDNFWKNNFSSWSEYQKSLQSKKIFPMQKLIQAAINLNSHLWNMLDQWDSEKTKGVRDMLENINTELKKLIG